jgi:hypothetical protein
MPLRANISPGFVWRIGLVALVCFAMAMWFLFDGLVTYPRQRVRALEHQRLEEEGRPGEWEDFARQRGWSTADPGEPKTEAEIYTQLILAGVLAPPGLWFLVRFLRARKRWIEADETGLRASWGQQLRFDQIVSLNKKQWAKKGIARITYRQDGRKRGFVLDDWKYEADPTVGILREVEARIDPAQIVGGPPEPPPREPPEPP